MICVRGQRFLEVAVISMTKCVLLTQHSLRAWRSQTSDTDFQPGPSCREISSFSDSVSDIRYRTVDDEIFSVCLFFSIIYFSSRLLPQRLWDVLS